MKANGRDLRSTFEREDSQSNRQLWKRHVGLVLTNLVPPCDNSRPCNLFKALIITWDCFVGVWLSASLWHIWRIFISSFQSGNKFLLTSTNSISCHLCLCCLRFLATWFQGVCLTVTLFKFWPWTFTIKFCQKLPQSRNVWFWSALAREKLTWKMSPQLTCASQNDAGT